MPSSGEGNLAGLRLDTKAMILELASTWM